MGDMCIQHFGLMLFVHGAMPRSCSGGQQIALRCRYDGCNYHAKKGGVCWTHGTNTGTAAEKDAPTTCSCRMDQGARAALRDVGITHA